MAITEKLQILIDADSKGAQRELAAFGQTAERSLGASEKKLQVLSGQMLAFGSATLVAGGVAAAGLFKLAGAASDLGEATNKANVVLGTDGAAALEKFAETAASTAGVSKRAALEAGAGFGLFVEKAGFAGEEAGKVSADLVQLAGDISSLNNIGTDEALTALSSALAGESEPVRRLGIDISDATLKAEIFARTGEKVTGTLSQQAKTTEILNQLFRQGAVFQGDFANTADSLANRQKQLAAESENAAATIGESYKGTFEALLGAGQSALGAFNDLGPGAQQVAGGVAGIATAGAIAAGGLALIVGAGLRTVDTFRDLKTRVADGTGAISRLSNSGRDAAGNLTLLGRAGKGLQFAAGAAGVALLADTLFSLTFNAQQAEEALNRIKLVPDGAGDEGLQRLAALGDEYSSLYDTVAGPLFDKTVFSDGGAAVGGLNDLKTGLENLLKLDQFDVLTAQIENLRAAAANPLNVAIAPELIALADQYADAVGSATAARDKDAAAADAAAGSTDKDADSKDAAAEAAEKLKSALGRLTAQQKLNSLAFDIGRARADSFGAALERSTNVDNLLKSGVSAGRALTGLRKSLGLIPEDAEEAAEETDAVAEAMDRLNTAIERTDPTLTDLGILLGSSEAAAEAFGRSLDRAGGFGDKLEGALGVGDAFSQFQDTFRRLPPELDLAAISLGKLRPRTADAVRDIIALGDATKDYLQSLIESGASYDEVRGEAARLRGEYAAQLAQLGLTSEQMEEYLRLTGTAPEQIETAIKLAGVEGARFKLQAYLGLLEGRIPPEVATSIIPLIESGNLDAAAAELAAFAATNPAKIDVAPTGTKELEEAEGTITDLPRKYDALTAATGGYSDATLDALEGVLGLGDAYRDFLSETVASDPEKAIGYAQELRDQFAQTVAGLNLTEEELASYYELLGIAPEQVTTAIELSNFDATVFEITTVISLLEGVGELEPEVALQLADELLKGDYAAVRALLESEVKVQLGADPADAYSVFGAWATWVKGSDNKAPLNSDPAKAYSVFGAWATWVKNSNPTATVYADTSPASASLAAFRQQLADIENSFPLIFDFDLPESAGGQRQVGVNPSTGAPIYEGRRASGGRVWPGMTALVGENGPEVVGFGASGTIFPTTSPPPLDYSDASSSRMLAQIERYLADQPDGGVTVGEMTVVAPEPELAGTELIRALRKRRWLGG